MHPQTGADVVARIIVSPNFLQQITTLLHNQGTQPAITRPDQTETQQIGFRSTEVNDMQTSK